MGTQSSKEKNTLLSQKEISALQQQILFEYPFVSSVYESMLVADNTRPDCPIVYANSQFEEMTLYTKEEVLGRNCRFLQGKYTDPNIIKKVRAAVDNSLPIDVELLNYRKDGVAFWNAFLMLPVHAKGTKSGKATHFIAIQKDVTLLKQIGEDPRNWTSAEVAMFLEQKGMGLYSKDFIENSINGEMFLNLEKSDFKVLKINLASEQKKIMNLVDTLRKQVGYGYSGTDSGSEKSVTISPTITPAVSMSEIPTIVPNQKIVNMVSSPEVESTEYNWSKTFWNSSPSSKMVVRCFFKGKNEPHLILSTANVTWPEFKEQIEKAFGNKAITYEEDNFRCKVQNETDLRAVMALTQGQGKTLSVILEDPES